MKNSVEKFEPQSGSKILDCKESTMSSNHARTHQMRSSPSSSKSNSTGRGQASASISTLKQKANRDYVATFDAVSRSQAIIEFNLDGTIVEANGNFLAALGYTLDEIVGRHHRMFCQESYTKSSEYSDFWNRLRQGEFFSALYRRIRKDGTSIWIQASYNPVFDSKGTPVKVVKFAIDVTEQYLRDKYAEAQITAINKAQAVIAFDSEGNILEANENFLNTLGYRMDDIKGRHHRMFCEAAYTSTSDYHDFWANLKRGKYYSGEFHRKGIGGKDVWIIASYNPIFDPDGKVTRVVKYATDITKEKVLYNTLVDNFGKACLNLSSSAEQLMRSATQVSSSSSSSNGQAVQVAAACEEVYRSVQGVSTATEEMNATVKEIASSANQTSSMSNQAKENAKQANEAVAHLGTASDEIGSVSKVISSIAQQTNLLALNATIEAARAGEAGRGFAVVANEVKELAKQTSKATDDITARILKIQTSTKSTIEALSLISNMIDRINQMATSTAVATEEQAATTNEVARLIAESNRGVQSITSSIREVAEASEVSSSGARETEQAAAQLALLSTELKALVERARAS
jgi:methyl-accepting chemotaxis protein